MAHTSRKKNIHLLKAVKPLFIICLAMSFSGTTHSGFRITNLIDSYRNKQETLSLIEVFIEKWITTLWAGELEQKSLYYNPETVRNMLAKSLAKKIFSCSQTGDKAQLINKIGVAAIDHKTRHRNKIKNFIAEKKLHFPSDFWANRKGALDKELVIGSEIGDCILSRMKRERTIDILETTRWVCIRLVTDFYSDIGAIIAPAAMAFPEINYTPPLSGTETGTLAIAGTFPDIRHTSNPHPSGNQASGVPSPPPYTPTCQ